MPVVQSADKFWTFERVFVCCGSDFEQLYPDLFENSGLIKSKLQMMSTTAQAENWRLGPILCGGLTLRHYSSFASLQTVEKVSKRYDQEEPLLARYGVHIIVSQNSDGQLIIGDSHEYGQEIDPFDKEVVNELIVRYTQKLLNAPSFKIQERWHGIYLKSEEKTEFIAHPETGVTIVNGLGGAGMTLSFGLAKRIVASM
jgi:FAD dependent oxidoreductase TIGR03364